MADRIVINNGGPGRIEILQPSNMPAYDLFTYLELTRSESAKAGIRPEHFSFPNYAPPGHSSGSSWSSVESDATGPGLARLWTVVEEAEAARDLATSEASKSAALWRRVGKRSNLPETMGKLTVSLRAISERARELFKGLSRERVQPIYEKLLKVMLELAYILVGSTPLDKNFILDAHKVCVKTRMVYNIQACARELKVLADTLFEMKLFASSLADVTRLIDDRKYMQTEHIASQFARAKLAWEEMLLTGQ